MNALEHGITEQSVSAIVAEAVSSFPEPSPERLSPENLSFEPSTGPGFHAVSTQATLTGAWNGTVNLQVPVQLAASFASALFGIPSSDITAAERADVVAELCNVVAGNLKGLIRGPSALSLPTINDGGVDDGEPGPAGHHAASPAGRVAVNLGYPFLGQIIVVQVIEFEGGTP
jgi:hypothetical protein